MRSYILRNLLSTRKILCESFAKNNRVLTYSQLKQSRQFSSNSEKKPDNLQEDEPNLASPINMKYKIFDDKDADVIFDVSEEQQKIKLEELRAQETFYDRYADINLNRGTTGVFEIKDLVTLLKEDKAKQIFVASVPKDYSYVDYIVIVTAKSHKHMSALATFVRKVYKLKRHKTDMIPKIEGENSKDWIALDLGNIALHIFSEHARNHYDLETLWTVGSQYDDKSNISDEEVDIMDQYNAFLAELEPANTASQ